MVAGSDRDGQDGSVEGQAADEFDEGRADAGGIDGERFARVGWMAGEDGPGGGAGRGEEAGEAAEELEIGEAEGEAMGEAEAEEEAGFGEEGDGVGAAGEEGEALEEDEGGGVVAAAEVEAEEEVGLGMRGDGFKKERCHGGSPEGLRCETEFVLSSFRASFCCKSD